MKRLAVLSAVHTAQILNNNSNNSNSSSASPASPTNAPREVIHTYGMSGGPGRSGRFETDLHGNVNILLGGAMLGGVIVMVVLVCYCCHRNMRKNRPHEYSQYWRPEPDVHSLEVFTMDSHAMQCYDRNAMSLGHQAHMQHPHHHHHHLHHHQTQQQQQQQQQMDEITVSSLPSRPLTPGPPPAYESLIFKQSLASPSDKKPDYGLTLSPACILPVPIDVNMMGSQQQQHNNHHHHHHHQQQQQQQLRATKEEESRRDDEGLPSYEAALKLEAHGYV